MSSKVLDSSDTKLLGLSKSKLALALLSFVAVVSLQTYRLSPALPTLLQDEYIYSTGTKYGGAEEAARFGNFLYFELYSFTALCGPDFYTCARYLNAFWFVFLLVVLFVFALRFFNPFMAIAITSGFGLGPLGIFSSLYMPEMMYFALASLGLVLFIEFVDPSGGQPSRGLLIAAFISIAVGAMVKPHATFLGIGLLVFLVFWELIGSRRNWIDLITNLALSISSFLAVKFAIGWILAGEAGITIFGRSYTNALLDFISDLGPNEELDNSVDERVQVVEENTEGITSVLDVAFSHFAITFLAVLILCGPLFALVILRKDLFKRATPLVIVSQLVIIGGLVSVFAAHLTANGDDHSDRLLFRYFEFLVPFITIIGLHFATSSKIAGWRGYIALSISILSIILAFTGLQEREWLIADSVYLFSIFRPVDAAWVWAVVLSFITYLIFIPQRWSHKGIIYGTAVGVAAIGQIGVGQQLDLNGFKVSSDYAGEFVYENYPDVPGDEILVLGSDRKLVEASMFLMDKPGIDFELFQSGTELDPSTIPEQYSLVVQTLGVFIGGDDSNTYIGDGFAVTDTR